MSQKASCASVRAGITTNRALAAGLLVQGGTDRNLQQGAEPAELFLAQLDPLTFAFLLRMYTAQSLGRQVACCTALLWQALTDALSVMAIVTAHFYK